MNAICEEGKEGYGDRESSHSYMSLHSYLAYNNYRLHQRAFLGNFVISGFDSNKCTVFRIEIVNLLGAPMNPVMGS